MSQILGCRQLVRRYPYDGDARLRAGQHIGQDLDAELAALDAAGIDPSRVFTDKLSGSAKTARPRLVALLDYARPGDSVVVAAIDRLGRSVAEVTRTIAISVNGESRCMSYAKASIRPRQQGELSRPSWPASPNWSSNWAASATPHPENPVAPGICRPPNPRSSAQNGKNSLRDSGPRLQRHRDRVAWQGILDRGATGLGAGARSASR